MSRTDLLARAESLRQTRTPYVIATVVRAQRPTSAKPGDSALILADGTLDGFVGGTCAESTVRLQGLALLRTGESTLLRITPEPDTPAIRDEAAEGLIIVKNPCLSGGSLEIFLEAMLPAPLVHVHGDAPVARALMRVGTAAGYDVVAADTATVIPPDTAAVVIASHGRGEESAIAAAVRAGVPYIALVASRRRGEIVLASAGVSAQRVHSPAGLDLGARTAPDVAVSILAQIIATRAEPVRPPLTIEQRPGSAMLGAEALDPVCGMTVQVTPDALQAEHAGQMYHFCGSGCKIAFTDDPHRYLTHD
jgi:xanthine dehydrogenase accessory factor